MPTDINFNKVLGVKGATSIVLPSEDCPPPPAFVDTNSFEFDGTTSYFDGNGVVYSELDNQTKLTLSFWVKPTTSTFRTIFSIANGSATPGEAQVICFLDASNRVRITFGAVTNSLFSEVDSIQVGFWNHVFIAIDLAQGSPPLEGRVYIDGIDKTDTVNLSSLTQFDISTGDIYIADDALNYQGKFLGYINELAIWPGEDYRNSYQDVFNLGLPNDLNNLPTNPIGQTPVAPHAWFRMGEVATYGGSQWVMRDVNNCYYLYSTGIAGPPAQPSTDVPLYNNKSFVFDGINDYVNVGSSSLGITSAITVSAWVKIPTTNTGGGGANIQVIACEDTTNGGQRNWNLYWRGTGSNYFAWVIWNSNGSTTTVTTTGITPNDGQWHHVLATYDGTSNANGIKLYIDGGTPFTGTASSTGIFSAVGSETTIGALTGGGSWQFEGNIDEVAVFDVELSASDVTTIYNGGVPNDISSLSPVSWWRMGEDALYNSGPGLWSFPDNGSGGNNGSSLTLPESARVSDVPT